MHVKRFGSTACKLDDASLARMVAHADEPSWREVELYNCHAFDRFDSRRMILNGQQRQSDRLGAAAAL